MIVLPGAKSGEPGFGASANAVGDSAPPPFGDAPDLSAAAADSGAADGSGAADAVGAGLSAGTATPDGGVAGRVIFGSAGGVGVRAPAGAGGRVAEGSASVPPDDSLDGGTARGGSAGSVASDDGSSTDAGTDGARFAPLRGVGVPDDLGTAGDMMPRPGVSSGRSGNSGGVGLDGGGTPIRGGNASIRSGGGAGAGGGAAFGADAGAEAEVDAGPDPEPTGLPSRAGGTTGTADGGVRLDFVRDGADRDAGSDATRGGRAVPPPSKDRSSSGEWRAVSVMFTGDMVCEDPRSVGPDASATASRGASRAAFTRRVKTSMLSGVSRLMPSRIPGRLYGFSAVDHASRTVHRPRSTGAPSESCIENAVSRPFGRVLSVAMKNDESSQNR